MNFNDLLHVLHLRSGAVVNPNLTPITGMSISIDEIAIQNLFGVGVGVYPAFQQNGKNYLALSNILVNSDFSWQTLNASGLTAASFTTISDANDHPDFSTTGSLIQFGFVTANNNGSPPIMASRAAGFDNWSYAVTTVPEPGSLLLCGVMALGWAVRRYRRTSTIPNERVTQ